MMSSVFVSSSRKLVRDRDYSEELQNTHLHLTNVNQSDEAKTFTLKWVVEKLFSLKRGVNYRSHNIRFGETVHRLRISRQFTKPISENPQRTIHLLLGLTPSLGESTRVSFTILGPDGSEAKPEGNCSTNWQVPDRKCYVEFVEFPSYTWLPLTVLCKIDVLQPETAEIAIEKNNSLLSDLQRLMSSGEHSDLAVDVDGQTFNLHSVILSARSPVFKAMFQNEMKEKKENRLVVKDSDHKSFRGMIEYLYTGKIVPLNTELALALLALADKYDVHDLQMEVEEYLRLNIGVENVICILLVADAHNSDSLKGEAISFIAKHLGEVIKSQDWDLVRSKANLLEDLLMYFM